MTGGLQRRVGLLGATALNITEMVGVGPFITIPLIVHAMGGPQAMLGWIIGAVFALCDGMVWAELGAAYPRAGGSYEYLKEIYGGRLGRALAFLYVWQASFSAPMSIASGCVGLAQYATFLVPSLAHTYVRKAAEWHGLHFEWSFGAATILAMAACSFAVFCAYRGIGQVANLSKVLAIGALGTMAWVIVTGLTHFHAGLAFDFPAQAFAMNSTFLTGLGAAMLIATYDYWGYYNVNFFGGEVLEPERNIPRTLVISICVIAVLYVAMNIAVLGVVPWRELDATKNYTVSIMMQRVFGTTAARLAAVLVIWTAFASVVSVITGVARVGYAAALDGNYFRSFAHLHPVRRFPDVSVLALGALAILMCTLRLQDLIAALVVVRIVLQFLAQCIGVLLLRRKADVRLPFRMPLFPLPALLATAGFLFVLFSRPAAARELAIAAVVLTAGCAIYWLRSVHSRKPTRS